VKVKFYIKLSDGHKLEQVVELPDSLDAESIEDTLFGWLLDEAIADSGWKKVRGKK
jgi:hypothetical protein